jgi:WD40 repeat protein
MDNKNYIIQLAHGKILINNFIENKLYKELMLCDCSGCNEYFTGFIYNKENIDYLYTSSKGQIEIWDLFNKNLCKIFKNIGYDITCMIRWNYKYILICDVYNECLKVFDLKNEKVISSVRVGKEAIRCVKKFYHPFYGESILTADNNNKIKLWITYKEDKEEDINEKNNNLFNLLINDIPNIDENIKEFLNYEFTKNKNKELYIYYSLYKEKNDKDDFIESIEMYLNKSTTKKLITKFNLKKEIKIKLSKINDDDFLNKSNEIIKILKKFSLFEENDINLMINLINDKNDIFIAAFEVYFENENFEEFYETISLALKFKNNK